MTKYEFLGDLSRLLSDLSEEERSEALQYYEDYFADAGREQEQAIIQELESPEKVAAKIRGSAAEDVQYGEPSQMRDAAYPEPKENFQNAGNHQTEQQEDAHTGASWQYNGEENVQGTAGTSKSEDTSTRVIKWGLIFTLLIIAIPVILPVAATLFGLLIAFVAVIFALFCALFGCGIGLGVGGVVSIFAGIVYFATANFAKGMVGVGAGLVMLPVGIILCYLGTLLLLKMAPGAWKVCQNIWNWFCSMAQKLFA